MAGVPFVYSTLQDHSLAFAGARASNANGFWLGTKIRFTAAGRVVGMSYGRFTSDHYPHLLMFCAADNGPIFAKVGALNVGAGNVWDKWHSVYFHPWYRIAVGSTYIIFCHYFSDIAVLKTGGMTADIVRGAITAPAHNPPTFYNGFTFVGNYTTAADAQCTGNLGAVDVLFLPD